MWTIFVIAVKSHTHIHEYHRKPAYNCPNKLTTMVLTGYALKQRGVCLSYIRLQIDSFIL